MNRLPKLSTVFVGVVALTASLLATGTASQAATVDYTVDLSSTDTLVSGENTEGTSTAMSADGKKVAGIWADPGSNQVGYVAVGTVAGTNVHWGAPVEVFVSSSVINDVRVSLKSDGSKVFAAAGVGEEAQIAIADVSENTLDNLWTNEVDMGIGSDVTQLEAAINSDFTLGTVIGRGDNRVPSFSFSVAPNNSTSLSDVKNVYGSSTSSIGLIQDSTGTKVTALLSISGKTQGRAINVTPGSPPSQGFAEREDVFDGEFSSSIAGSANGDATFVWTEDGEVWSRSTVRDASVFTLGAKTVISQGEGTAYSQPSVSRSSDGTTALVTWRSIADGEKDEVRSTTGTLSGSTSSWASSKSVSGVGYSMRQQSSMSSDGKSGVVVYFIGDTVSNRRLHIRPISIDGKSSKLGTAFKLTDDMPILKDTVAMSSGKGLVVLWKTNGSDGMPAARVRVGLLKAAPTPPNPTGKKAQAPTNNCVVVPKRLPRKGTRVLMKPNCKTNAKQRVKVKVTAKLRNRGEVTLFRVYKVKSGKNKGQTRIRTYGFKLKAKIAWSAPATTAFKPYKKAVTKSS